MRGSTGLSGGAIAAVVVAASAAVIAAGAAAIGESRHSALSLQTVSKKFELPCYLLQTMFHSARDVVPESLPSPLCNGSMPHCNPSVPTVYSVHCGDYVGTLLRLCPVPKARQRVFSWWPSDAADYSEHVTCNSACDSKSDRVPAQNAHP